MRQKKFILQEKDIPTQWYNIQAEMPNKPLPPLNPQTHKPMTPTVWSRHWVLLPTSISRTRVSIL